MIGLLKEVISIRFRPRHDSYSDQWNRIFMSKLFFVISIICGIEQFNDSITCVVPSNAEIDSDFVKSTCWINGFYVFPKLIAPNEHASYYGIPRDLALDGLDASGDLCSQVSKYGKPDKTCEPFERLYFLQYQWFTFFLATLGLMFYLPYLIFRVNNEDTLNLMEMLQSDKHCVESIIERFFEVYGASKVLLRMRVVMNPLVKFSYIFINLLSIHFINTAMNNNFLAYGSEWIKWMRLDNHIAYDMTSQGIPTPGNVLLPSMGICEVHELSRDIRNNIMNRYKFVCEISQHILYQYCFLFLWFFLIATVIISFFGLVVHLYDQCNAMICMRWYTQGTMSICRNITLREFQYLRVIRENNVTLHNEVIKVLTELKLKRYRASIQETLTNDCNDCV